MPKETEAAGQLMHQKHPEHFMWKLSWNFMQKLHLGQVQEFFDCTYNQSTSRVIPHFKLSLLPLTLTVWGKAI
jgi:hypothetical protein